MPTCAAWLVEAPKSAARVMVEHADARGRAASLAHAPSLCKQELDQQLARALNYDAFEEAQEIRFRRQQVRMRWSCHQ